MRQAAERARQASPAEEANDGVSIRDAALLYVETTARPSKSVSKSNPRALRRTRFFRQFALAGSGMDRFGRGARQEPLLVCD